jgi:hypothetical protein
MSTRWTPEDYDRHTEQLKKTVESLRKQDEQVKAHHWHLAKAESAKENRKGKAWR